MKKMFLFLTILSFLFACNKEETIEKIEPWKLTITENRYNSLKEIFGQSKFDVQEMIMENDEKEGKILIEDLANKIGSYIKAKDGIDITEDYIGDPQGIVITGIFLGLHEKLYLKSERKPLDNTITITKDDGDDFGCFLTAVGTAIGLFEIQSIYESIVAGASRKTVISAVKLIARRTAGVITVGIMIYEVGECLEWWG